MSLETAGSPGVTRPPGLMPSGGLAVFTFQNGVNRPSVTQLRRGVGGGLLGVTDGRLGEVAADVALPFAEHVPG